ncbi:hypothetical protein CALCODRAFT_503875 [Calocera cornea HHB12733]|uniref:NAD dependent epimerase/dehydratase n=1 Tax=Calocera cornea HHB12733 TaxID=1353952 RepID=A0A165CQ14_9BASI|nr:hypothetical protein CALCODRAFT_503875 [Calocera cornea HHB12733]
MARGPARTSSSPELTVIGAGFGRTGTSSLKEALEILGFGPCHHMSELVMKVGRCQAFIAAYNGEPTDWRKLMRGWASTVDDPTSDFVPELMAAYPKAKVILTVRDTSEAWWKSFQGTLAQMDSLWTGALVASIPPLFLFWSVGRNTRTFRSKTYGSHGPEAYEKHNARMIELVPKEKMLVFNVKEGWAPLCKFLGVPVPKVPFPRTNETEYMLQKLRQARIGGAVAWTVEIALVAALASKVIWGSWGHGFFGPEL